MKMKSYLIVNGKGEARVIKRMREDSISLDEVAFELNIEIPDGWGRIVGHIDVTMPGPPSAALVQLAKDLQSGN